MEANTTQTQSAAKESKHRKAAAQDWRPQCRMQKGIVETARHSTKPSAGCGPFPSDVALPESSLSGETSPANHSHRPPPSLLHAPRHAVRWAPSGHIVDVMDPKLTPLRRRVSQAASGQAWSFGLGLLVKTDEAIGWLP